jgi:hypothetical protein
MNKTLFSHSYVFTLQLLCQSALPKKAKIICKKRATCKKKQGDFESKEGDFSRYRMRISPTLPGLVSPDFYILYGVCTYFTNLFFLHRIGPGGFAPYRGTVLVFLPGNYW